MRLSIYSIFLLIFAFCISSTDSYKILIFAPGISNSQLILNYRLGDLLASRGHDVTVYVAQYYKSLDMKRKPKLANLFVYPMETSFDAIKVIMDDRLFEDANPLEMLPVMKTWFGAFQSSCETQIADKALMSKLKNGNYDLAIGHMYDFCPLGMIRALEIPSYIWMSSGILLDYMAWYGGVPSPASYVPSAMASFSDRMTLAERFKNFLGTSLFHVVFRFVIANPYRELFKKYYGPDFPDILELAAKSPLIFVNSEELLDFPRPILHKIIYVGGIDMNQPEPLTPEWQELMDRSNKGVVLFSFGSVVNSTRMPAHWKTSFLEAFARFPDYTFIWKYDDKMPEAANIKNVKLTKWAPQKDLLAHPKMKAFITHCGFNSLLEAASIGVPMLALPIFGDQLGNVKRAERHGIAFGLKKSEMSTETVYEGLKIILTNANYTINAKRVSGMIKKKPVKADQLAVGWVEFLAEHKELPNLQPVSTELNFIQYFLIDVALILLLGLSVILFVTWIIAKCLLYRFCKKGSPPSRKRTKSKMQ